MRRMSFLVIFLKYGKDKATQRLLVRHSALTRSLVLHHRTGTAIRLCDKQVGCLPSVC